MVSGWACAVCGATSPIDAPFTWRCPNATPGDRHHAPQLVQGLAPLRSTGEYNPFLGFRRYLAWDAFAAARGLDDDARIALVAELDTAVAGVAGTGFVTTPFERSDALSDALGFTLDGGVWVKDETRHVAGSHKARHLFGILLHLVTAERTGGAPWTSPDGRAPLAIASCGNAALAASTLAAAVQWPIRVFVPVDANPLTRRATRACTASANRSRRAPCRSVCRARRTRGVSTVAARSVGRWPAIWRRPSSARRSIGSSCRSAGVPSRRRSRPASA
jgi:threonine synthase